MKRKKIYFFKERGKVDTEVCTPGVCRDEGRNWHGTPQTKECQVSIGLWREVGSRFSFRRNQLRTLEIVPPALWNIDWYSSPSEPIDMCCSESTWHPNARKAVDIIAQICLTPSSRALCHVDWLLWACLFEFLVACSLLNSVHGTLLLSFTLKHLQSVWSSLFFSITYSGHPHTLVWEIPLSGCVL